jgi:hypothetical protein
MSRMTVGLAMARKENKAREDAVIGLSQNADGVKFQCGTCEYFADGTCRNINPKLYGRPVKPEWCCNLYDHDGMKVIVT